MIDDIVIGNAGRFLWMSGRVLEQRRFEFLFGDEAEPTGVLAALDAYRSLDGGYAFGLEPDVRGPAGQPISVPSALRVLEETGSLPGAAFRSSSSTGKSSAPQERRWRSCSCSTGCPRTAVTSGVRSRRCCCATRRW